MNFETNPSTEPIQVEDLRAKLRALQQENERLKAGGPNPQGYAARGIVRDRLCPMPEVEAITGVKKTVLYELMKAGKFPTPVQISSRRVGWPESRVQAWLHERIAAADARRETANPQAGQDTQRRR